MRVDAGRLVEARLGRPPQDMLEAAVVLEAWAGVPAQRALETARGLMPAEPAAPLPSAARRRPARPRTGAVLEGVAFVTTVLAIALWAQPLATALGAPVVERALTLALPLTLALQWGLRSRYLGRPKGLLAFARHGRAIALGAAAILVLPAAALGGSGALAGLLTLTWISGTVLIRRGWYAVYGALVLAATPAMLLLPPVPVLAGAAALTVLAVAFALRPGAPGDPASPGRWTRAGGGALIGAAIGLLLVADPTIVWADGSSPALALLPSTIASLWAGHRLWTLDHLIPHAVTGIGVDAAASGRAPLTALLGALARLLGVTALLSAALLVSFGSQAGLLTGFGLLALATLLASLLESLGAARWAIAGVLAGLAVTWGGAPLAVGAAAAVVVLLPPVLARLARPARTLATALWIT